MADKKNFIPTFEVYSPLDLSKKWFVYWYLHGKRHRKYGSINSFDSYEGRMNAARELIVVLKADFPNCDAPIAECINEWLKDKRPFWKKKTIETYQSVINSFLHFIGNREADKEAVQDFFRDLGRCRSGTTYNNYRIILNNTFNGINQKDFMEDIHPVKAVKSPARYFQPHQVDMLKEYIPKQQPELWLFVQFLFYCFIRPRELRQLKAGDVFFDEAKIMIRSKISKNNRTQYIGIPDAFLPELLPLKKLRPNDFIFPSARSESKPIGINTMGSRHRVILDELGFSKEYKLYSWKHTGAVMAVQAGVTVKELQMQLRHHSLDQVNEYLRQMGVANMSTLRSLFPQL